VRRFLIQTFLFSFVVLVSIELFSISNKEDSEKSDYLSAIIDKHARLASLQGRRLLLVGGSNVAFGIDGKRIEDSLHIPVMNLAMHAGLGLDFLLSEAQHVSRKGDIILLSTEYYLAQEDDALKASVAEVYPEAWEYFNHSRLLTVKTYYRHMIEKATDAARHTPVLSLFFNIKDIGKESTYKSTKRIPVYARKSFNSNGDYLGHIGRISPKHDLDSYHMPAYRYYEGIDKLNEFYVDSRARGIKVYFTFPVLATSTYLKNQTSIQHYAADFSQNLLIPILNKPTSFVLPDNYFYDFVYHPTKEGREIRTNRLIAILKRTID
jgi:hypothetical protein